jgi:hypothetical protein
MPIVVFDRKICPKDRIYLLLVPNFILDYLGGIYADCCF